MHSGLYVKLIGLFQIDQLTIDKKHLMDSQVKNLYKNRFYAPPHSSKHGMLINIVFMDYELSSKIHTLFSPFYGAAILPLSTDSDITNA